MDPSEINRFTSFPSQQTMQAPVALSREAAATGNEWNQTNPLMSTGVPGNGIKPQSMVIPVLTT